MLRLNIRYFITTTFTQWALNLLPDGHPGRIELAAAQLKICQRWGQVMQEGKR